MTSAMHTYTAGNENCRFLQELSASLHSDSHRWAAVAMGYSPIKGLKCHFICMFKKNNSRTKSEVPFYDVGSQQDILKNIIRAEIED